MPTKYEENGAGAYGFSVSRRNSLSPPNQLQGLEKSCDCPMCYHSVKNPCSACGCPSRASSLSLKVNVKQRGPSFTDQQSTQAFFSPSSDYYSLSPNSPPPDPEQLTPEKSEDIKKVEVPEPEQPIYAKVNKNKSMNIDDNPSNQRNKEGKVEQESDRDNGIDLKTPGATPPRALVHPGKRPSAPDPNHGLGDRGSSRRHSWAGDKRRPGNQKQTSLHDFKKLLAQQSMGQNPHRISAKELLEKSALESEAHEPCKSSQKPGGSLRKRSSPWKDNRFSIIQEEIEGSRENLLNGKG